MKHHWQEKRMPWPTTIVRRNKRFLNLILMYLFWWKNVLSIFLGNFQDGLCDWRGGFTHFKKGKCYQLFADRTDKETARKRCHAYQDGELASVPDEETNTFLGNMIRENKFVLLGAYKDRARQWHWYDGETWDFENWKYGHKPATDDPFPTSQDIVGYGRSNGWSENQGFFQYICQSSTGYLDFFLPYCKIIWFLYQGALDTSKAENIARDDDGRKYWEGRMYEPLVGMAAFMSQHFHLPRGLVTIEGLTVESKVVLTGELIGVSGNAGYVRNKLWLKFCQAYVKAQ